MVYVVKVGGNGHVNVVMSLTTPACPLSSYSEPIIPLTVSGRVKDVGSIFIEAAWEPRWQPQMMSAEAKQMLGWSP